MVRFSVIPVALSLVSFGDAFVVSPIPPSFVGSREVNSWNLNAAGRDEDSGGGAAIAKPAIKTAQTTKQVTKQKSRVKKRNKVDEPTSRREDDFEEAPLYKVMLLGDDAYDLGHVVERLCAIVEEMDEDQAANVFQQAQQEGKAMCGKYPMEHAEMYKEQLLRSDPMIFSDIEEENK